MLQDYGTHYHHPSKTVFTLGTCCNCGEDIQEPNAIGVKGLDTINATLKHGLIIYRKDDLPMATYWSEKYGDEFCEDCCKGE